MSLSVEWAKCALALSGLLRPGFAPLESKKKTYSAHRQVHRGQNLLVAIYASILLRWAKGVPINAYRTTTNKQITVGQVRKERTNECRLCLSN